MKEIRTRAYPPTAYPALRILLTGLAGYLLCLCFLSDFECGIFLSALLLAVAVTFLILRLKAMAFYTTGLLLGLLVFMNTPFHFFPKADKIVPEAKAVVSGKVERILSSGDNYTRCIVRGTIDTRQMEPIENAGIMLSVLGRKEGLEIEPGCKLAANAKVRLPKEARLATDFNEPKYYASMDVQWIARAFAGDVSKTSPPSGMSYLRHRLTGEIRERVSKLFPEETAGIATALATGEKSNISREQRQVFSYAGTAHVLAVSGFHVGIITLIFYIFLGPVQNKYLRFLIISLMIAFFVFITGFHDSAFRAGLMAATALFVKTINRRARFLNIISAAILILILLDPSRLLSAGFQMSALSVFGIALLFEPLRKLFSGFFRNESPVQKYLSNSVAVTLAASAAVSPVIAYYFDVFSLISPLTNLFVLPMMSLGIIYTYISIALSFVSFGAAQLFANAAQLCFSGANELNSLAIQIPFAYFTGPKSLFISLLFAFSAVYMAFSTKTRTAFSRMVISVAGILLILVIADSGDNDEKIWIIPRDQYTAAFIPINENKTFAFLADRLPSHYPVRDFAMEEFLTGSQDTIFLGLTGNAGQNIFDRISEKRENISSVELSHEVQKKISNEIGLKKPLQKIIEHRKY